MGGAQESRSRKSQPERHGANQSCTSFLTPIPSTRLKLIELLDVNTKRYRSLCCQSTTSWPTQRVPDRTVVKIDVEGHERSTLEGMERTLRSRGRRPDIIIEFLGHAIEHEQMIERAISYGLDVYYIGPTSITPLRTTTDLGPVQILGYFNFLLTSRPTDEISALSARAGVPLRQ